MVSTEFFNDMFKFEREENFKRLGFILNEDNINQRDLQERIENANKAYFMLQFFFFKIEIYQRK